MNNVPAETIRLVLDQGVPRDAADLLRRLGHDCVHAGEVGLSQALDEQIIAWAREQGRLIVTLDADFHAELAVSGASAPSVVRLRMQGLDGKAVAEWVTRIIAQYSEDLARGCLISVKSRKTTVHRLPVGIRER